MSQILAKRNIHPIVLPSAFFTDRFGMPNALIDMNPSMYIDTEGNVTILVRRINYRKFHNKQFTIYGQSSNSTYSILTGKLDNSLNLDLFIVKNLEYVYNRPIFPTYWKGLEDIRFVNQGLVLAIIPECNPRGNPSIFRAALTDNTLHSFTDCLPNNIEKNWMPFIDSDNTEKVIYSLSPFRIKSIDTDQFTNIQISELDASLLKGYNGSTNGIRWQDNQILFLIHTNLERTVHRWLLFDLITRIIQLSKEFIFFQHSYIEFPISLCEYKDIIYISMGLNDDKAFIVETDSDAIKTVFS